MPSTCLLLLGSWQPHLSDPSPPGIATVAAYGVVALLWGAVAWRARQAAPRTGGEGAATIYWIAAAVLTLLCLNKGMNLLSLPTELGRELSHEDGWYGDRRLVQVGVITLIGLATLAGAVMARARLRAAWKHDRTLIVGLGALVLFVLIRAASLHQVDRIVSLRVAGVKVNWVLELSLIGVVAAPAVARLRRALSSRRS